MSASSPGNSRCAIGAFLRGVAMLAGTEQTSLACRKPSGAAANMQRLATIAERIQELNVPLFSTLDTEDLAALTQHVRRRVLRPTNLYFQKGIKQTNFILY